MKYRVGDKVRLKGTDSTGTVIDIIRNQLVIILSDGSKIVEWPENVVLIKGLVEEEKVSNVNSITQDRVDKLACKIDEELPSGNPYEWECPDGYEFRDEKGNVINATKIVLEKKKKEYPKTYEECCEVLEYIPHTDDIIGYKWDILQSLQKLLICRDAYWKMAGEEMGFGGPWEPDWTIESSKYIILFKETKIEKHITCKYSRVFAFPTEEMRDAFKENFKSEIESCKELL